MIIGWFGLPRVGKTYLCCLTALRYQRAGYQIFSNVPIKGSYKITFEDIKNGVALPRRSVFVIDEVQKWANAREWSSLPVQLYNYFSQGGKMGVELFYTAQDSSRVDKTLREVTNYFYYVQALFPLSVSKPLPKDYKPNFFRRIIYVDVFTNNIDFSFVRNRKGSRDFEVISPKNFKLFNSFYIIKGIEAFHKKEFEVWTNEDILLGN